MVIQQQRKELVPPEPSLSTEHVVLSVRHSEFGTVRRIFSENSLFNSVYNWIGSLAPQPLHFGLLLDGQEIPQWKTVSEYGKVVLNMLERETPINDCEDVYAYADHEKINEDITVPAANSHCVCKLENYLKSTCSPSRENPVRTIVVHRRPTTFWQVLFKQKLDASIVFRVIWAGETGSDEGGPFREFLLKCMDFTNLNSHFFGDSSELMFTSLTDSVLQKEYYLLGQLCALAILNIGRGPNCFHPAIVDVIFSLPRKPICAVNHGEFEMKIKEIRSGQTNALLDANINPTNNMDKNLDSFKEYFCILSRMSGIEQFKQGNFFLIINSQIFC